MVNKIFLAILITFVLAMGGILSYLWFSDSVNPEEQNDVTENREETGGTVSKEEQKEFEAQGKNPFGDRVGQDELRSSHYNEYIHGMAHQKVEASKKWGFYEITDKRINWLLEGLDNSVDNKDLYSDILEQWKEGDFSNAVSAHNDVWDLEGGTVGKATGLLSIKEEQDYIESQS
ncbi:DUF6241 domain-containing protein [Virgibacillus sp. CBA3643]|uniref:DUF6241 domain-containing protein n=1 Tax=Virgibacillus sp. CBA3643 TaxID=2942278 RepID=UPI0035A350A9